MAISFQTIPANNRVPGVFAEFQPQTAVGDVIQATCLIGQMLPSGTAVVNVPVLCGSPSQAAQLAGAGSMLARMAATYFLADPTATVYLLPLADDPNASKAAAEVALSGTAVSPGTLALYADGDRFPVAVVPGDTAITVAARLMAAFAQATTSFTPTVGTNNQTIILTARNAGLAGNDMDVRVNFGGLLAGEVLPAGLTAAITPAAGGAVNPTLDAALANLGDLQIDFYALPYSDSVSLDGIKTLLDARWSWSRAQFGQCFTSQRGTLGAATTLGAARNDQYTSILPAYGSPTHPSLWAAAYTATAAVSIKADPALPINTAVIAGVLAPAIQDRFDFDERGTLLYSGMSTFKVQNDGTVVVERAITTAQTADGVPSTAYLNVERVSTLTSLTRSLLNDLATTFARRVLVSDADTIPAGSSRVNAKLIKAHIVASYLAAVANGLAQNADEFAAALVVENQGSGKVAVYWPADLANQLEQIGVVVAFTSS